MKEYGPLPTSVWTHTGCACGGIAQFVPCQESIGSSVSSSFVSTPTHKSSSLDTPLFMPKPLHAVNFMRLDMAKEDVTFDSGLASAISHQWYVDEQS
jgi:hypothetical protein